MIFPLSVPRREWRATVRIANLVLLVAVFIVNALASVGIINDQKTGDVRHVSATRATR